MSVKSGRGLATSRPDLGTLVEEDNQDPDDLPNRHTVEAEVEPEPYPSCSSSPSAQQAGRFRHVQSEEGRSLYETASSKFSMENVDKITNRIQVSPTGQASASRSQNRSPQRTHRKSASVSIEAATIDNRYPNFELIMAQASTKTTNDIASTTSQRRFSLMNFLNNVTAPMRRTKTATEPGKRRDAKEKTSKLKQSREGKTFSPPSVVDSQISQSNLGSTEPHQIQLPSVPCSSFDVCQVTDNLSDVYRPANVSMNPSNDRTSFWSAIDDSKQSDDDVEGRRECQVCFIHQDEEDCPILRNCDHRPCKRCLIRYLQIEIMESRISLACPECITELHPNDIQSILKPDPHLVLRYERFMIRKVLITEGDVRWCPAPDCDYAVIASGCAACPQLECQRPGCGTLFCYHCKGEWHANQTCDEARGQSVERMFSATTSGSPTDGTNDLFKPGDLKACPRCGTLIVKMNDGSCNHMVCPMCQADFCWLCLKEISDLHYLSPTGCTFWGKKPWTRKKKLLWQVGTLIGAPVGIALIAGLAIPGIICGVPVFVGRKAYQRFKQKSRGKRRLVTAASVAGSLIVSPVLAVMAVGVGVPIMLAYVYGVVPLSLCRNGGCAAAQTSDEDEKSPRLLELAEDAELGRNFLSSLRVGASASERSRLLSKKSREVDHIDATSVATINSGFSSLAGPSASAHTANPSTPHPIKYGSTQPADTTSQQSASLSAGPSLVVQDQRKRKVSVESWINSMGEKCNFECASTKANAGSHYHFDNKSVNTVCSGAGPEVQSYNEESASVLAMSGSIGGKSLEDGGSIKQRPSNKNVKKSDRDISP